jgi:drug/metabolite transporter (DMT)-like permease
MNSDVIQSIIYVLLFTTCIAYLLNAWALKSVKSSTAGAYIYLQPLLATFFALLFGKDELNGKMIISACLIFTGLYLVSKKNKKNKPFSTLGFK